MPAIVYNGVHASVELAGVTCRRGEPVVFPAEIAKSVCEQATWSLAPTKKVKV